MKLSAVALLICILLTQFASISYARSGTDSLRLGVFPFWNQSKQNFSDADLDRIVGLLEGELISCSEVSVIERERIKEIWAERQKAETFPDIYDSTQFMKYRRVFQVRYGLIGKGFLKKNEIVVIIKIVDGETAKTIAAASGAIPPVASLAEEKVRIRKIVDELFLNLGLYACINLSVEKNDPPIFTSIPEYKKVSCGEVLQFTVQAKDKNEDDTLRFYMLLSPVGATLNEFENGLAEFMYKPPKDMAGEDLYPEIYVSDGRSWTSHTVRIKVLPCRDYLRRKIGFGVWLAIGGSQICLDDEHCWKISTSYAAGGFLRWFVADHFALQPEVIYSKRGTHGDMVYIDTGELTGNTFEYNLSYLDFQLLAMLSGSRKSLVRAKVLAGMYIGFSTKAEWVYIDTTFKVCRFPLEVATDNGYLLGFGLEYGGFATGKPLLVAEFRAYQGLKEMVGGSSCPVARLPKGKNCWYSFMFGFGF